jgi:hypothetical protein
MATRTNAPKMKMTTRRATTVERLTSFMETSLICGEALMEVLPRIARRRTYVGAILSKAERSNNTRINGDHNQEFGRESGLPKLEIAPCRHRQSCLRLGRGSGDGDVSEMVPSGQDRLKCPPSGTAWSHPIQSFDTGLILPSLRSHPASQRPLYPYDLTRKCCRSLRAFGPFPYNAIVRVELAGHPWPISSRN